MSRYEEDQQAAIEAECSRVAERADREIERMEKRFDSDREAWEEQKKLLVDALRYLWKQHGERLGAHSMSLCSYCEAANNALLKAKVKP